MTVGLAFALHPEENFISHVLEACLLSSARTGLCAAIAAALLTERRKKTLAIIGSGKVGYYAALYIAASTPIQKIFFHDTNPEKAMGCADALQDILPQTKCRATDNPFPSKTDIILLATTSTTPLCSPSDTRAGLVISVGADTDFQSELTNDWPKHAEIYIDTPDSLNCGDLREWRTMGRIDRTTDLFRLINAGQPAAAGKHRKVYRHWNNGKHKTTP